MALTKKDIQEVIDKSEENLRGEIKSVQSDVKILGTLFKTEFRNVHERLDGVDQRLDKLTELATDTLTAVSSVADNVPSLVSNAE